MKSPSEKKKNKKKNGKAILTALVADERGEIFELEGYAAVGMSGDNFYPLFQGRTSPMPHGSELMFLPDRSPILLNLETGNLETLSRNPYAPDERLFPVAAFNSPGYILTAVSAFTEEAEADYLPLFSYGAVGWGNGGFRSSVLQVDKERRQDLRLMPQEKVASGVRKMKKVMPGNRLRRHLEKCALVYGCPAGKNFFLQRYEAPLPTSRVCNADCMGCISLQKTGEIHNSQDRIDFTPSPEEICEVALHHINRVKEGIVSFGQGCEGDPIFAADVIEPAIKMIRAKTSAGTINMNTNGSKPEVMERLFAAGLDSIRISMNSVREPCYNAYFRPKGYSFESVVESMDRAKKRGIFVSINYLNVPGFTDSPEEFDALREFLQSHRVNLIQWRNLNFDPIRYWNRMQEVTTMSPPLGVPVILKYLKKEFPDLRYGYFNPPRETFDNRKR